MPTVPAPITKKTRSAALSTRLLLDAAAELIAEVGLHETTLVMIGERAGYSHGLVTRRFGSKEGLLLALVEKMTVGWFANYIDPEIGQATGREAINIRVRAVRDSWARSRRRMCAIYTLMFDAVTEPIPALTEQMQRIHQLSLDRIAESVNRGVLDGSIRDDADPVRIARVITGGLRGAAYLTMLSPQQVDIFDALDDLQIVVDKLIAPDKDA